MVRIGVRVNVGARITGKGRSTVGGSVRVGLAVSRDRGYRYSES